VISLFEVAVQAAVDRGWLQAPSIPSFRQDVFPTLERSFGLRWVHEWQLWDDMPHDWARLSDRSNSANQTLRQDVFNQLSSPNLQSFEMPPYLRNVLQKWVAGNFTDDWAQRAPAVPVPSQLDRASLEACIGANFFPGIEAGSLIKNANLYQEPFRFSHQQLDPGNLTEVMALPWQADFHDCADDWWPSQRPNDVFAQAANVPNAVAQWAEGVQGAGPTGRLRMVRDFSRLGFVVPKQQGNDIFFLEDERDPTLPGRP
jgi:hypothetical protein